MRVLIVSRFGSIAAVAFRVIVWLSRFFEFQCSAKSGEDGAHAEAECLGFEGLATPDDVVDG